MGRVITEYATRFRELNVVRIAERKAEKLRAKDFLAKQQALADQYRKPKPVDPNTPRNA